MIKEKTKQKTSLTTSKNWSLIAILLIYSFIAVLTPNMHSFDSNGPKFLAVAILNLIVFTLLIVQNDNHKYFLNFFRSKIGIAFSLLILFAALSFINSHNIGASLISFSKMFTVFSAAIIISVLLQREKRALKIIAIGMALLLVYDSFSVFIQINQYIKGDINSINLIKSGYSNKNVLAASLFIKIPFALWLLIFQKKWLRYLGITSLFFGVMALLFMSSRTFYIGIPLLSGIFILFLLIRYFQHKNRNHLINIAIYIISVAVAFLLFSTIEQQLYPTQQTNDDKSISGRLATISKEDGGGGRLQTWEETAFLIEKNPLLGVGAGNWKTEILKYENLRKTDFVYKLRAHNDFLQITAETGIPGGLSYLFIFIFTLWIFLKIVFRKENKEKIMPFFIAAFGLFAYSLDAFFNFPHDRPEIQTLFAFFIGIGVAYSINHEPILLSSKEKKEKLKFKKLFSTLALVISIILLVISAYLLHLNFKSLKIQRLNTEERYKEYKTITADFLIKNLPTIPSLNNNGIPINILISSKLMEEGKFDEVVTLLHKNNISPYDSRKEYYLSVTHMNLNNTDSAQHYIQQALKLKPKYYPYIKHYTDILTFIGKNEEAIKLHDSFLKDNKAKKEVWIDNATLYSQTGDLQKSLTVIDSALIYFPDDSAVVERRLFYAKNLYMPEYEKALTFFREDNFREAVKYFKKCDSGFNKAGGYSMIPEFLVFWSRSHFMLQEYPQTKSLLLRIIENDPKNYNALMILGNIAYAEKEYDEAIYYLEKALQYGSDPGTYNNLYNLWSIKGDKEKMEYYKQKTAGP